MGSVLHTGIALFVELFHLLVKLLPALQKSVKIPVP
jgi:hypothetical protein